MGITTGLLEWFKGCELIEALEFVDVNQLPPEIEALGLYKQPSRTTEKLIDGTTLITDVYYLLFKQPSQLKRERLENDEYLENVENWVESQEWEENYPDIGYQVHEITVTNTFYMMESEENENIYQLAISITYEKGRN